MQQKLNKYKRWHFAAGVPMVLLPLTNFGLQVLGEGELINAFWCAAGFCRDIQQVKNNRK
jgi:hypothetical protein